MGRSKARAKVPSGGLTAPVTKESFERDLGLDVRLALSRAQSRFAWIDPEQIQGINFDDWYNPKKYSDIEQILKEHGASISNHLDQEVVELYVEVNTILAFIDAVFSESKPQFIVKLRNSDGSLVKERFPIDYSKFRQFLRPAMLDAMSADDSWLAFFQ